MQTIKKAGKGKYRNHSSRVDVNRQTDKEWGNNTGLNTHERGDEVQVERHGEQVSANEADVRRVCFGGGGSDWRGAPGTQEGNRTLGTQVSRKQEAGSDSKTLDDTTTK